MLIQKAYRFRLKPTPEQQAQFRLFAGQGRFVWNEALRLQKERLEAGRKLASYAEMCRWITDWKQDNEMAWLKEAPIHTLQQRLKDFNQAIRLWRKDLKAGKGEKGRGFPTFRKRYVSGHNTFRFPDPKQFSVAGRRVKLPKLGWVRFYKSQQIEGTIKNATVRLDGGHWYISFQVEQELPDPIHPFLNRPLGIDLGVATFAALSDGSFLEPIGSFRKHERRLAREQHKLSRKKKHSGNWKKQKRRVDRLHARIAACRKDYLHKASTTLAKNHGVVVLEHLQVSNLSASAQGTVEAPGTNVAAKSGLNKSILDQGWYAFRQMLQYKLDWSGGALVLVSPQYTSQRCSECGHTEKANRKSQAVFECVGCGHGEHADTNAAKNILAVGQTVGISYDSQACGSNSVGSRKQEPALSESLVQV